MKKTIAHKTVLLRASGLAWLLIASMAFGQHERFDELAEQGESALRAGNYERAITCFEEIAEKGQTYVAIFEIRFDLGWAYYLTGRYEQAIPIFRDLSGIRAPSDDMREQALFLLAECHARLAGDIPEDDPAQKPERDKNLETAIKLHTEFQTKYSKSQNIPESLYGRAYAYYLAEDYNKAEQDLTTVINRHTTSPTVVDARYLLASVYAKQGLVLFKENKRAEGEAKLLQARSMFESLTTVDREHTANDAAFAMAETWFSAEMYPEAITYYHKVQPKTTVLRSLRRRADSIQERMGGLLRQRADISAETRELNTIRARHNTVNEAPDLMVSAFFRIADAYHRLKKYDESRIVARHLARHTTDTDQKKQALLLSISAYMRQEKAEEAGAELMGFVQEMGPDHTELKSIALGVGQLFMLQNKITEANEFFDIATRITGDDNDQTEEDARYMKISGLYYDNRFEECISNADEYIEKFPEGGYIPNALYFKSVSYTGLKDWEQALKYINELLEKYPSGNDNFDSMEEASYQKGWILVESKDHEQAVEHFKSHLDAKEDGNLRPEMLYQMGIALHELERKEEGNEILRQLAKEHPENQVAPYGLYQIAVSYFQEQDFEKMGEALNELVESFPEDPIVTDAYYFLGFGAQREKRFDDAIGWFRKSIESNPAHERASQCLLDIANSMQSKASAMGRPAALSPELQELHKKTILEAATAYEELLAQYPASLQALQAVTGISKSIHELVRSKQITEEEAEKYFEETRARHTGNSEIQAQIEFSFGVYLMNVDLKERALESFKKAISIDPDVTLSAELLANYARALIEAGELDEAQKVCVKIENDYPGDEAALAPATFLVAQIKFLQRDFEEARALYEEVLEDYPWYDEGRQGLIKLAEIYEINGELQKAEQMFTEVFEQSKRDQRVAAAALLAVGRCQVKQAQLAPTGSAVFKDKIKAANGNLMRLVVLYEAYSEHMPEGLYWNGIVYEMNNDLQNAANSFGKIVKTYPRSDWVSKARERLSEIGKKGIVAQETAGALPAIE